MPRAVRKRVHNIKMNDTGSFQLKFWRCRSANVNTPRKCYVRRRKSTDLIVERSCATSCVSVRYGHRCCCRSIRVSMISINFPARRKSSDFPRYAESEEKWTMWNCKLSFIHLLKIYAVDDFSEFSLDVNQSVAPVKISDFRKMCHSHGHNKKLE